MTTFEQALTETERAATSAVRSASNLLSIARQMQKAAQEGNISNFRRITERLKNAATVARQEASNVIDSWPFSPEAEEEYLRQSYEEELLSVANSEQLKMYPRDGQLICFPSILRILPSDKAVQLDRKKVSTIRPARLVALLKRNQQKPPRFRSEAFLESLFKVYQSLAGDRQQGMLQGNQQAGPVIALARIYELFTSLPRAAAEYNPTDFARDLYFLDASGVRKTRTGAAISFPASTGTRSQRDTFRFVSPEGELVIYYGIQFFEGQI
jgi:hypothetical protein